MDDKRKTSASTTIEASPETVYGLVSDLTRMGEWSPEATGGKWIGGATGPAVGARFKGTNAQGAKKWTTTVTVLEATSPSRFRFANKVGPKTMAVWTYEIKPFGKGGCKVTESWADGRGPIVEILGKAVTGVVDRAAHTKDMLNTTLARLKEAAESGG